MSRGVLGGKQPKDGEGGHRRGHRTAAYCVVVAQAAVPHRTPSPPLPLLPASFARVPQRPTSKFRS